MRLTDESFMAIALRLARRGLGCAWPNPSVGAVVVRPGPSPEIVGRGWTMPGGRPHAEKIAIDRAGEAARGATLYVTLEPCCHKGRAEPCTDVMIAAGVSRVVCALGDPDTRVAGRGFQMLRQAGIRVTENVLEQEARLITLGHILRVTEGRPLVTLKVAAGNEGLVPRGDGAPVWVTEAEARAASHLLRARHDAILVGRGTVEADDPELTCRLPGMEDLSPVRIVLDSSLATSPGSKLVRTVPQVPLWIFCREEVSQARRRTLTDAGAQIISITGEAKRLDLRQVLSCVAERGITRLLVEGGPAVLGGFLGAGLADFVSIFEGSRPAGEYGLKPFGAAGLDRITNSGDFMRVSRRSIGPDRLTQWQRKGLA